MTQDHDNKNSFRYLNVRQSLEGLYDLFTQDSYQFGTLNPKLIEGD